MSTLPIKTYFTLTGPDGAELTLFTLADLSFDRIKSLARADDFGIYVDHGPGCGDAPLPGVVGLGRATWIRDAIKAVGQTNDVTSHTTCRGDTITLADKPKPGPVTAILYRVHGNEARIQSIPPAHIKQHLAAGCKVKAVVPNPEFEEQAQDDYLAYKRALREATLVACKLVDADPELETVFAEGLALRHCLEGGNAGNALRARRYGLNIWAAGPGINNELKAKLGAKVRA